MVLFITIVLGPACLFLLYVLAQFWLEAMRLRAESARHRAAAERLIEVSARSPRAEFGRPDITNRSARLPEEYPAGGTGILAFPSSIKHSARRNTA